MFGGTARGDQRVRKILDAERIKYEIDSDGDYKVIFDLGNGRTQLGIINSNTESFAGVEVRDVWSVGLVGDGQLNAAVANALLAKNAQYKVGAWQIVQRKGKILAIFRVSLSADATTQELMSVLQQVLLQADEVEKEYLGTDGL